jgi:hypothetical protein
VVRGDVDSLFAKHDNTCPTPNDIAAWPEWYLSDLYPLFPDGYIVAEGFVVHCAWDKVPSKNDVDQRSKANLYIYVRDRLKDAIGKCCHLPPAIKRNPELSIFIAETTIGHEIYQRTVQINYCASDPQPPNSFEWVFSPEYPEFPSALSLLDRDDLYKCINALENGKLRVVRKEAAPLDEKALANLERVGRIAKNGVPALIEEAEKSMLNLIGD